MLYSLFAFAALGLSLTASAAGGNSPKSKPECVDKCWTNSQYVSLCMGDHQCLCDDSEFQNAVYQCLYSQCSTAKFGTALHHALQACHVQEEELDGSDPAFHVAPIINAEQVAAPALLRMDDNLKQKRAIFATGSASGSVSASKTRSVTKSASKTMSAGSIGARPSRNASVTRSKATTSASARASASVTKSAASQKSASSSAMPSVTLSGGKSADATAIAMPTRSASVTRSAGKSVSAIRSASVTRSAMRSASASGSYIRRS